MDCIQHDENTGPREPVEDAASNGRDGISGPQIVEMTMTSDRLAITPGDHEKRGSGEEQSKSAVQQEREFPKIVIETETIKGNAERPSDYRCGISLNSGVRHAKCDERSRDEANSQSALFPIHCAFLLVAHCVVPDASPKRIVCLLLDAQSERESPH